MPLVVKPLYRKLYHRLYRKLYPNNNITKITILLVLIMRTHARTKNK